MDHEMAALDPESVDSSSHPTGEPAPGVVEDLGALGEAEAWQVEGDGAKPSGRQLWHDPAVDEARDRHAVHQDDGIAVALLAQETLDAVGFEPASGRLVSGDRLRNVRLHGDSLARIVAPRC
jgi:hypothetical protein